MKFLSKEERNPDEIENMDSIKVGDSVDTNDSDSSIADDSVDTSDYDSNEVDDSMEGENLLCLLSKGNIFYLKFIDFLLFYSRK